MIVDELVLIELYVRTDVPKTRPSLRSKAAADRRQAIDKANGVVEPPEVEVAPCDPRLIMHSVDELTVIQTLDDMPAMRAPRRTRAPTTMAARPRVGRPRPSAKKSGKPNDSRTRSSAPPTSRRRGPRGQTVEGSGGTIINTGDEPPQSGRMFTIGDGGEQEQQTSSRRRSRPSRARKPPLEGETSEGILPKAPKPKKPRASRAKKVAPKNSSSDLQSAPLVPSRVNRRKPLTLAAIRTDGDVIAQPRVRTRSSTVVTFQSLIDNIETIDTAMKERAQLISLRPIVSEPVMPIHTAIRVVLQATLDLGRPYDTNMLASTLSTTRSIVMQAMRKSYDGLSEQSDLTEADFVPTYLWIYGMSGDEDAADRVKNAIVVSGAGEPGCRSVFAIARDFVILYISEVLYGVESVAERPELAGLASAAAVMSSLTSGSTTVPKGFLEMTNSFLYRARMTARAVMRARTPLLAARGGAFSSLFTTVAEDEKKGEE